MSTGNNTSATDTAKLISAVRQDRGASLRDFAADLGVSANAVSMWERGVQEPGRETLVNWYTDERDWVHKMAVDIFVSRYRETLVSRRITVPLAA